MDDQSDHPTVSFGRSLHGFGLLVLSLLIFILFIFFAYVPDSTLQSIGFYFYPDKKWLLAIPIVFISLLLFFLCVIHPLWNLSLAHSLDSINLIRDSNSRYLKAEPKEEQNGVHQRIPPVSDLKIQEMCQLLYYDESLIKED